MARQFEKIAKDHFIRAVRKVLPKPTPLIGEKWFRFHSDGRPADLEFTGVRKLAKATGIPAERIAARLLRNLSDKALDSDIELTEDNRILVRRRHTGGAGG